MKRMSESERVLGDGAGRRRSARGGPRATNAGWKSFGARVGIVIAILVYARFLFLEPVANAAVAAERAGGLRTLTRAAEVHGLSSREAARGYPVHLRGVVTYFDPALSSNGFVAMFVHDESGCIYVQVPRGAYESLRAGSLIDLRGDTDPGEFAPIVAHPRIEAIGSAGLPANPSHPSHARLMRGVDDGQWVEVEGVVHSVIEKDGHENLQLAMADGPISILMGEGTRANYAGLVDAKVRIRGNAGPLFDLGRRQMIAANIHCPNLTAVKILEAAPADPFNREAIAIDRLLQWDLAPQLEHRVHVRGRVTLQWPGSPVCIRDGTRGVCAQTEQDTRLVDGEPIDLAGFARAGADSAPVLTDAVFRRAGSAEGSTGTQTMPVAATPVTAEQALMGSHESDLIQIEGHLISRDLASQEITLLVSSGKYIFKAVLPATLGNSESTAWRNGSTLRVTGICSVQIDAQQSVLGVGTAVPTTFRVLLSSSSDVLVLRKPSWWTPNHALAVLAVALSGTLAVLAWVVSLRRRVDRQTSLLQEQTALLRESEERFRHMALHDGLTGLATRLLLQDRLEVALENARRGGAGLAVLMLDLDRFKQVNDTFGHPAGDEVLRATATRLTQAVRASDTVARMGGDEFVILLPDVEDLKTAEAIALNIVGAISMPILFAGHPIPVSGSVGVCTAWAGELDAESMLRNADAALYRAKGHGRNRFEVFAREPGGVMQAIQLI